MEHGIDMQIQIHADGGDTFEQVEKVLQYYLPALDDGIERFRIDVQPLRDELGNRLYRCEIQATLVRGEPFDLEETQADLVLTITRALDRTARTLRRRQATRSMPRSASG